MRAQGISKIREIADALEKEEMFACAIQWMNSVSGQIESMDFGNPIITDALALHVLRVRIKYGAEPAPKPEQNQTKQ